MIDNAALGQVVEDLLNRVTPFGLFAFVCWMGFAWWFVWWVEKKLAERDARQALAARQEAIERARREEYAVELDRMARESWLKGMAIQIAMAEAEKNADQLGFTHEWIRGGSWFFKNPAEVQDARMQHRSGLVKEYTAQILGTNQSPIDLLRQQNAYGDAAFAGALALEYARGNQPTHSAGQLTFED